MKETDVLERFEIATRSPGSISPAEWTGRTGGRMDETAHAPQPALLVPVDFSARSLRATVAAVRWAHAAAQRVVLLHVIDVNLNWPDTGPVNVARLERKLWAEAQDNMKALVKALALEGAPLEPIICEGLPWEEILRVASTKEVSMIIFGQPARKGWRPFGRNTVKAVMERSPRPVVVLAQPEARQEPAQIECAGIGWPSTLPTSAYG